MKVIGEGSETKLGWVYTRVQDEEIFEIEQSCWFKVENWTLRNDVTPKWHIITHLEENFGPNFSSYDTKGLK